MYLSKFSLGKIIFSFLMIFLLCQCASSGSLPLSAEQFYVTGEGKIHVRYFKEDLENMIKSPYFAKISASQQEVIKKLEKELGPGSIAVMTLE